MQIISTSTARRKLSSIINTVRYSNKPVIIGRHDKAEALLIKFPNDTNIQVSKITNINQYGGGFDFLSDEPDIYTKQDLKKSYV